MLSRRDEVEMLKVKDLKAMLTAKGLGDSLKVPMDAFDLIPSLFCGGRHKGSQNTTSGQTTCSHITKSIVAL